MKKIAFSLVVACLALCAIVLLASCGSGKSTVATYTANVEEDGGLRIYTLTVDEKNNAFSIESEGGENRYSGSFSYNNGYLILQSEERGKEYVRIVGETFSYFTPDEEAASEHEHAYVLIEQGEGTCREQGYEKYECSICGKRMVKNTSYGTHRYEQIAFTQGTCKQKSVTKYRCVHCGDERSAQGEYGEHRFSTQARDDTGCGNKVKLSKRCLLCGTVEEEETEEYGTHLRDEHGVCTVCGYDRTGFCHSPAEGDEREEIYGLSADVCDAFATNGYAIEGETLWLGTYPQRAVDADAETLIAEGKTDPDTGYVRYKGVSYAVVTAGSATRVFLVEPIAWRRAENGEYRCDRILDGVAYLSSENLVAVSELVEYQVVTTYYNGKTYDKNSAENDLANDYAHSDVLAFANGAFLARAFTPAQAGLLADGLVTIPAYEDVKDDYSVRATEYARFVSGGAASTEYFTSTPSESGDRAMVGKTLPSSSANDKRVDAISGFRPAIRLAP